MMSDNKIMIGCYLSMIVAMLFLTPVMTCYASNNENVGYQYDDIHRIRNETHDDGMKVEYEYDSNGNITDVTVIKEQTDNNDEQTEKDSGKTDGSAGRTKAETGNKDNKVSNPRADEIFFDKSEVIHNDEDSSAEDNISVTGNVVPEGDVSTGDVGMSADNDVNSTDDLNGYNEFKRKRPSIKKLTITKKRYIRIKIGQAAPCGQYGEIGYQVKYSNNQKFKKSAIFKVLRKKKGKYTTYTYKKKKMAKNRKYYFKVRAFMKTSSGKTIYSKYSKVKSIKE